MKTGPVFAVLGGGHGGFAMAGDLACKGFPVHFYSSYEETIGPVRRHGGIEVEVLPSTGLKGGLARLQKVTTDLKEALAGADVVMVVTPANKQADYARRCAPYLVSGQVVVLHPGNFGGSIQFKQILEKEGKDNITVAETECLIYSCRKKNPVKIWIRGYKRSLRLAAFPSVETRRVLEFLRHAYPYLEPAANVLETGLSNPNPIVHTPLMVLNAGRIEGDEDFLFYWEGMTPAIGRTIEIMDEERLAVGRALGLDDMRSIYRQDRDWFAYQGGTGSNIYEAHVRNPIYQWSVAPATFDHRYLTEDIPFGLVPLEDLAEKLRHPAPTVRAIIHLANILTGKDLRREARTLADLGLDNLAVHQLLDYVDSGSRQLVEV
ncbi:MAG: NAD/NADP octopine/nopaline dehydrogenase family protein [bacterium]|jgi:opine dehydrogenase